LNTYFAGAHLTFPEYIEQARNMIAQARLGATPAELDQSVAGNAPFELHPAAGYPQGKSKRYRRGILLVHGLTDSPYFMRHLAAFFQQHGFRVMAVLLPGHGTRPGDMLEVRWQEWLKAVAYGVEQLALEADEIYLGGYSAGGALSVCQSLQDTRIRGLFLFAPAFRISPKAAWANCHKAYSWLLPAAQWLTIHADADLYKYESFAKNAAAQMHALTQKLRQHAAGRMLEIPVFAVVSQDDATVDSSASVEFMRHAQHPGNRLVYYFSDAAQLPAGFANDRLELVDSVFPEHNIISSAHTAIVLSGEDGYYGEQGAYRNCLHYRPQALARYAACCGGGAEVKLGEITQQNLQTHTVRRLMYNPNFARLSVAMQQFIAGLPD
jgi:esterase/lipase